MGAKGHLALYSFFVACVAQTALINMIGWAAERREVKSNQRWDELDCSDAEGLGCSSLSSFF